jgi:protein tyrosine/serine phosphatase
MMKKLQLYLFLLPILASCSQTAPDILVACEENNVGNCVVKWETLPSIPGKVKVYASTNPDDIVEEVPIAMTDISSGFLTIVTDNPSQRYYFLMDFNGKYRYRVAPRNLNIAGIQNFRDMGGYRVRNDEKSVRWGMLYRSADIDNMDENAIQELHNIGIRTIIDLRDKREIRDRSHIEREFKVVHLPIKEDDIDNFLHKMQEHKIVCDTVSRLVEQSNRNMVKLNQEVYRKIFNVLLDRHNYPVIIHCSSGEGRTGIVSALILSALNVNDDEIMDDYCLSNKYFKVTEYSKFAYDLPDEYQEAVTTIFSAKQDFLDAAFEQMKSLYGDVDTYLEKGVGLSKSKIKRLRSILLIDN